jgi:GNAT superfamily N-acetyltransferase
MKNGEEIKVKKKKRMKIKEDYFCGIRRYSIMSDDGRIHICSITVEKEDECDKAIYIPDYIDKKVLYLADFNTLTEYRHKGYATKLLKDVIRRFKGKYDVIHLNACPYYYKGFDVVYEPPKGGLDMDKLTKFYESYGFKELSVTSQGWKVMLLE